MSLLIFDEQINREAALDPVRSWVKAHRLIEVRSKEHIDDDRIPLLLRTLNRPTFVTIDEGFWDRRLRDKHYCILYLALRDDQQPQIPSLLRKLLRLPEFKTKSRANRALRQGARSLHRSPTYLGAYFRRMRIRLGAAKAVTATAHKLACMIYKMLKEQIEYVDSGEDFYLKKNREREIKRLNKRANALGFYITPIN